jgi:endoglucanase
MANTVTYTTAYQITTAAGAYIGQPYSTMAAAGTALTGMAPGAYTIIPISIATVSAPPQPVAFGVKVTNGKLTDMAGNPMRMKGVNISGAEFAAIQGWATTDILGGQVSGQTALTINWAAIKAWVPAGVIPAVRVPFNTASLEGATTYDYNGAARKPAMGSNYSTQYVQMAKSANAAGVVFIADQHWSAPNMVTPGSASPRPFSPMGQGPAADTVNSIDAMTILGTAFKGMPGVIIDLFNEYMLDQYGGAPGADIWATWLNGGTCVKFPNNTSGGSNYDFVQTTQTAGMQQLLDAFRATGASNICITGGVNWGSDNSGWLAHKPNDPLGQLMASSHFYPSVAVGAPGYASLNQARCAQLQAIVASGVPCILGEVGGAVVTGATNDAYTDAAIAFAVANDISYVGWAWDTWANATNVLIKDSSGTPTPGFGMSFKAGA